MNKEQIAGDWKQIKGEAKIRWGKLTDNDMTTINGETDKLLGKIQERYGYAKERAEKELSEFTRGLGKATAKGTDAVSQLQTTKPAKKVSNSTR